MTVEWYTDFADCHRFQRGEEISFVCHQRPRWRRICTTLPKNLCTLRTFSKVASNIIRPRQGSEKLAGGRAQRHHRTPVASRSSILKGWQITPGPRGKFLPSATPSGIPPGCGNREGLCSGGVAALNHRLISDIPSGWKSADSSPFGLRLRRAGKIYGICVPQSASAIVIELRYAGISGEHSRGSVGFREKCPQRMSFFGEKGDKPSPPDLSAMRLTPPGSPVCYIRSIVARCRSDSGRQSAPPQY